jgi:ribosomal protein S18 acetylase RimI-like enzyme
LTATPAFEVRQYEDADEQGWVRCRVLGFLDSAFFDDVRREKEHYAGPAIELVAVAGDLVVGLLDLEVEPAPGVLWDTDARGGVIWHVAVHPDHRRCGIGSALVDRAFVLARDAGLEVVQAWTRDDPWVHAWYEACGFKKRYAYLHVYLQSDEVRGEVTLQTEGLKPVLAFAHYTGGPPGADELRRRFQRTHDDVLFERAV